MIVPLVSYAKEKSFYQGNYKGEEDGRDRGTFVDLKYVACLMASDRLKLSRDV